MDAMERQVVAAGYDGATTRSIADDAGVQVANLRHHFGSKAGLFAAATDRAMDRAAEVVARHLDPSEGDVMTLGSVLRSWGRVARDQPETAAFLAVAPVERTRHEELRGPLGESARWLEATVRLEAGSRHDAEELADALIAIVFGLVAYPALVDPTASAPDLIDAAARLFDEAGI